MLKPHHGPIGTRGDDGLVHPSTDKLDVGRDDQGLREAELAGSELDAAPLLDALEEGRDVTHYILLFVPSSMGWESTD